MTDEQAVAEEQTIEIVRASPESQTWARKLMDGIREVQELHRAEMFEVENDDARMGCVECTRVAGDEIEDWPCATAIALGIEEGPLL